MFNPAAEIPPLKIGFYRTSSIGDIVLGTVCLDFLERLKIPYTAYWVGRGPALALLQKAYPKLRCVELVKTSALKELDSAVELLKDVHFIIDLQTNVRSKVFCQLLRSRFGVPNYSAKKLKFARAAMVFAARLRGRMRKLPDEITQARSFQYQAMLDVLLEALRRHLPTERHHQFADVTAAPRLPATMSEGSPAQELVGGNWLAIAPGAAHPTKRAPKQMWSEVLISVRAKVKQSGQQIGLVFLGDETDRAFAIEILESISAWNVGPVLNLAGRLNLWECAQALSRCRTLIGNDSSLSHIAEAVGVPVGVLFGPTVEAFGFAPKMPESKAFSVPLGCRPCSKHGKVDCRYGDQLCFTMIKSDDITQFALSKIKP